MAKAGQGLAKLTQVDRFAPQFVCFGPALVALLHPERLQKIIEVLLVLLHVDRVPMSPKVPSQEAHLATIVC